MTIIYNWCSTDIGKVVKCHCFLTYCGKKNLPFSYVKILFHVDSFGSIQVAELSWGNVDQIKAVDPPFDYIIGTDVGSFVK